MTSIFLYINSAGPTKSDSGYAIRSVKPKQGFTGQKSNCNRPKTKRRSQSKLSSEISASQSRKKGGYRSSRVPCLPILINWSLIPALSNQLCLTALPGCFLPLTKSPELLQYYLAVLKVPKQFLDIFRILVTLLFNQIFLTLLVQNLFNLILLVVLIIKYFLQGYRRVRWLQQGYIEYWIDSGVRQKL